MNHIVYQFSLCVSLSLMLFFSFFFLLAPTPEKNVYRNFLRSRRIMGVALLALSANYSVHLFCGIRFISQQAAILMNLSTYFLCYWLFSSALMTLLNRFYLTFRRFAVHLFLWVLFTGVSTYVLFCVPLASMRQSVDIGLLAGLLLSYGVWLSVRLINTYRQATRSFDDLHSENVGVYVKWMNVITYWAVIYGVGCGLLTFLPDEYINWWILSSIPFYIYLFCSYQNYMLFHEQVERMKCLCGSYTELTYYLQNKKSPQGCTRGILAFIHIRRFLRNGYAG